MFRGSSTQLYIPAFTQKDFNSTSLSTKDSHKGNLHRGFGAITITRSTQLLSLQTQPPPWGTTPSQQTITSQLEGLAQSKQGSPHNLRDTTQMHNLLNTMRERHKAKQRLGLQLGGLTNNHKQSLFPHKDPIEWDSRCSSSVEKTKGMEIKNSKKIFGKN